MPSQWCCYETLQLHRHRRGSYKPLIGLSVTAYTGTEDLFGKTASDLQTGVTFSSDGTVTGTLKHVTDYTGFSSKVSEQSGNYLAFKCTADVEGATITAKITKTSTLDSDGISVFRVADKTKKLVVTASKEGYETITKEFDLNGLTLNAE